MTIFNPNNSQLLYSLQDDDTLKHHLPVTQIRFRIFSSLEKEEYSHILVASYASGHVKFWHYTSGKCLHTINEVGTTLNVALNPEGTKFITTGDTTEINIYDEETKKKLNTLEPRYLHGPHICGDALDIDPYNNHILTGSWRKKDVLQTIGQVTDLSQGKVKYFAAKRYCKTHHEYTLDYFCTYHDALCCHGCIAVDHRACNKIFSLKEASKDVRTSALIVDIFDGLKHVRLGKTAIDTIHNREEYIQRVNQEASSITESISAFKKTIIDEINEMEKSAMSSLSNLKNETISKMWDEKDS
ncbi:unnamed protein product [Mytilus coruscus]|uniref:Uncharacterized protein n=1 Tax=Mytilus coruscus TaxID=42192 RepID=A0A6J8EEF0_MYTCO|nr:unnamed protein product [Mytilus coruscus]